MKQIRNKKVWTDAYADTETAIEDVNVLYEFNKEGEATDKEVTAAYNKAFKFIEELEFKNMLSAEEDNLDADVFGPLAFDNSISKKSAAIKGVKSIVAGEADVLLVPSVETGNALVKMMIYFMGACAAGVVVGGKVPIVITSRSDEAQARLASIAAAVVALD